MHDICYIASSKKNIMMTFNLETEFIPLIQLLKAVRIAQSGGEAQMLVEQGMVTRNGVLETRKRAKLRDGDIIKCSGFEVIVKGRAQ
jgi:ribosome-associated protein